MDDTTYQMLEEAARVQLEQIASSDPESKEGKEALTKSVQLVELLTTVDKINADYHEKMTRHDIDIRRNEIESEKQQLSWGRVVFEMAKLVVPIGVSFIGYNVFQKRILKFEETGRITSTAGRELHLPRFFK